MISGAMVLNRLISNSKQGRLSSFNSNIVNYVQKLTNDLKITYISAYTYICLYFVHFSVEKPERLLQIKVLEYRNIFSSFCFKYLISNLTNKNSILYKIAEKNIINFIGRIRKELCPPVQTVPVATIAFHRYLYHRETCTVCPETLCPEFSFLSEKNSKNCSNTQHILHIFLLPCV